MSKTINKSVQFNLNDPDHVLMLDHAGKRASFSEYVRRLIDRDRLNIHQPVMQAAPAVVLEEDKTDKQVISNSVGGFI
ncbi:hypothetical protein BBD42_30965 [Paenibacillus sp. BIHB 4019]|uniref:Uncharacterized protein n=1 Tax=Paenibacillus sp. BIHB 4019 TaxID=1870819 RepID=A0A1B2DRU0_9BACL|nr:hypothetical protein [Paenibacillus sp. BIHB 4019]ANY70426.1 hypothetical protein BBD42_30965 [Paenibacillus sp. BIHB 4019]